MITPSSIIKMCNVPIDSTNSNQLRFTTAAAQTSYFSSVAKHTFGANDGFSFLRKDSIIRVNAHIDTLIDSNYVMYNNLNYTNRWFYAFITKMDYISDGTTALTIETDVYQTWLFDITFKSSFILREHETNDTPGSNLIDEGLELGDYIVNGTNAFAGLGDMDIVIASTTSSEGVTANGYLFNKVYAGCWFYGTTSAAQVGNFIQTMEGIGKLDSILSIFMVPHLFTQCGSGLTLLYPANLANNINKTGPGRPGTLDGYAVKNAKLKTFPYSYLHVHNNAGNSAVYKWELFDGTPAFIIYGGVAPNAVYKMIPMNLIGNGLAQPDYEQGLTLSGFPVCAWNGNVYSNWIAQNSGSVALGLVTGGLTLAAGIAAMSPMAVAGGVIAIGASMASLKSKELQPPQANGSINSANANATNEWNDFIFTPKSIRAGYAQMIDKYFDMYGYKQNKVKVPNLSSRPYWNYVKTVDVNITGDIPCEDMAKLKTIFNTGVTLWHNPANVGNYDLNNH